MRALAVLALVAILLVPAPPAGAAGLAPPALAGCRSPPCGYIVPILDLEFPGKPRCGVAEPDVAACIPLPPDGSSRRFEGNVTWWWRESDDLILPPDTSQPIVITFGPVANAPPWLTFAADPPSYTIDAAALADPRNSRVDDSGPSPVVYYWFHRPLNVTFTRHGGPDAADAAALAERFGELETYVRGASTPSGNSYAAAFGLAIFRYDARELLEPAPAHDAPPAAWAPLAALAGLAAKRRLRPAGRAGRRA